MPTLASSRIMDGYKVKSGNKAVTLNKLIFEFDTHNVKLYHMLSPMWWNKMGFSNKFSGIFHLKY